MPRWPTPGGSHSPACGGTMHTVPVSSTSITPLKEYTSSPQRWLWRG